MSWRSRSRPAVTLATEAAVVGKCSGFQPTSATFLCCGELGVADVDEDVGIGRFQLDVMAVDGRLRGLKLSSATIMLAALGPARP